MSSPSPREERRAEMPAGFASGVDLAIREQASKIVGHWANPFGDLVTKVAGAIQAEKAKGDHFISYFERLAREHPAANAALDTARREWAKKREGK